MTDNVLIVDDSLTVRMDLAEAFEAAGLRPLPCATVAEAQHALAHERIAVAILDVRLPDGDGIELLRQLREHAETATAPILVLSTAAEIANRIHGLQTGADDYVGKPYDRGYVVARARELLRGRLPAPTPAQTTVLIVDDSPTFREELRLALERAGYSVLVAAGGEEGLRLSADRRPAALIVDGAMPGIDGGTVIRRVRLDAALRGTPCVLLTASGDRDSELSALDAGADAFVRKDEDFDVLIARLAAVLRSAGNERVDSASLLGPKRVLAVDDSATYLEALAAALRVDGYDVVLARSGEEAIEMLAVQPADCILLDLIMPGLSGTETCRRIKASPVAREIPLIMVTAREDRGAMLEGLGAGADDYISKTSEFEVLKARVRAQLRRKQFEDVHRKIREDLLKSELAAAEARAAREVAETRAALSEELERKNRELEAFSYSVSHDLRAPLRTIDGFSQMLVEDAGDTIDAACRGHVDRIRDAAKRMAELIEDLLHLARVSSAGLARGPVALSDLARAVAEKLRQQDPAHAVELLIAEPLTTNTDAALLRVLLENLLGNAWKFSSKTAAPRVEIGATERDGATVYFVRDNGAGFDMAYANKLFSPFQRLHTAAEFPGTGIGLATVQRIVERHGGRVWAEGEVGRGAAFYFTLPSSSRGR